MNLKVLVEKLVLNSKQENFDSNGQPVKKRSHSCGNCSIFFSSLSCIINTSFNFITTLESLLM